MKHPLSMRHVAGLALILAFCLQPADVLALDDGGGRSIMAYGAGNRALALGGAYAAIANDASAAIWNPGGLGFVQRKQLQASHTNLIGLGFSEQYAAFVLPSWQWGVAGVTFRKFGVDGLERRDDRNFLLDDDLSDSETELGLAYGRKLGTAWGVGANLKMQRQSLAGFTDSGVGLDLGVFVQPLKAFGSVSPLADRLSFGLAARNAVEPAIRLDQESVPDPTGIRAGLAYQTPLSQQGWLLAALDLEKTKDMDSRLHVGLEASPHPVLALRVGVNHGTLTAGTGIRWRDVGMDYMYEDVPHGGVHRLGLSLAFGPTVDESRQYALAAEEERLQQKLTRAFEARNQERLRSFLSQSQTALQEGNFEQALQILAMVQVLDPENAEARTLEVATHRNHGLALEQAGDYAGAAAAFSAALRLDADDAISSHHLITVRKESDRLAARSAEIRTQLDKALDDFARGDLLKARNIFQRVLQVEPADQEAVAMLRRTDEAIQDRAKNLVEQARALIQAEQLQDARSILQEAGQLDPSVPGLAQANALLADRQLAAVLAQQRRLDAKTQRQGQAAATSSAGPATGGTPGGQVAQGLSEERQREIDALYRRGLTAMESGQVNDAINYWELVWSADPEFQKVSDYLKQEYLTRGMEFFVSGDLNRAVSDWERALRVDPHDERARGYLERAHQQLTRINRINGGAR